MGGRQLVVAAALLTTVFAGCFEHASTDQGAASKPDDPRASDRGGNGSSQADKVDSPRPGGFSNTSVFPGKYRTKDGYSLTLETGPYAIGEPKVENLPMGQGGANAQLAYVLPVGAPEGTEFPVIVQASIYYDALKPNTLRTGYNSNPEFSVSFLLDNYVPHGYAVALVPLRGTAGNGGCYEWWGDAERNDLRAAIDWIKKQDWSADAIGLIGLSMAGAATWMAAGLGDPAIKTIVPVASEMDMYSWFVRNGTPSILAAPVGTTAFWGLYSMSPFNTGGGQSREPAMIPGSANCPSVAEGIAANAYMSATGGIDPNGYAKKRDLRPMVEANYHGSVFLIHGLHDWLAPPHLVYPWTNQLEERGLVVKHLVGQWRHRMPDDATDGSYFQPTRRIDFAETLLHWFDYWLKEDKKADLGPRAQVADSQMRWRNEQRWPPPDATPLPLYAAKGGQLGTTTGADETIPLAPDPRRALVRDAALEQGPCATCPTFKTAALPQGLRFAGLPHLDARVTPLGPGGILSAQLYASTGTSLQRLGWAVMDLRFANGATTPQTVVPGTEISVRLEFEPLDAVVPPGSSLVLEISEGGYGEDFTYLAPKNQALAPAAGYRGAPNYPMILAVGGTKTTLTVPSIERAVFFDAPVESAP